MDPPALATTLSIGYHLSHTHAVPPTAVGPRQPFSVVRHHRCPATKSPTHVTRAVDMALARHRGDKPWTAMDNPAGLPTRRPPLAPTCPQQPVVHQAKARPGRWDKPPQHPPFLQAQPSITDSGSRAPSRPNRAARGPAPQAWGERRPVGTIRTSSRITTGAIPAACIHRVRGELPETQSRPRGLRQNQDLLRQNQDNPRQKIIDFCLLSR